MLDKFKTLLDEFGVIEKPSISPPTFLEIAGHPHYENVCSNILAFFFDSNEAHCLENLFITSMLNCIEFDYEKKDVETLNVSREVLTTNGNRIDLVIECGDIIIVIENKIWARLYNNLEEYSNFANKEYDKERIKIVLSILPVFQNVRNEFVNVTYTTFFEEIKKNIGDRIIQANPKYLTYLTDFIESILNLMKPDEMNKEMLDFFILEKDRISELLAEKKKIDSYILKKIKNTMGLINLEDLPQDTSQWIYQKCNLVHDIKMSDGVVIGVDCIYRCEGIKIRIRVRGSSVNKTEYLKNLEIYSESAELEQGETLLIQKVSEMNLLSPKEEIAEKLNAVLSKIKIRKLKN